MCVVVTWSASAHITAGTPVGVDTRRLQCSQKAETGRCNVAEEEGIREKVTLSHRGGLDSSSRCLEVTTGSQNPSLKVARKPSEQLDKP